MPQITINITSKALARAQVATGMSNSEMLGWLKQRFKNFVQSQEIYAAEEAATATLTEFDYDEV